MKDRGRWIFRPHVLAAFAASLACLYVISFGPVFAMLVALTARYQSEQLVRVVYGFYAPMIWLHENTSLREPLDAYLRLWI